MGSHQPPAETAEITETLKRAAAALRGAGVPFALAGSVAAWARGGPAPCNDLDFAIPEEHAEADEHALDFAGGLAIARALREQIDWRAVRERTAHSAYARGFLALLEALEIIRPAPAGRA